jgi:2-oxoglutarate dehydrogenase E2 component (dihydrolipoamide succinyltransferase)
MSVEIRVPTLGESIVDATIAGWLKKEGDAVQRNEALVELETDKINVEVNAEQDGILQKIVKQAGDVVAVGEVIGTIGAEAVNTTAGNLTSANGSITKGEAVVQQVVPEQKKGTSSLPIDTQRPPSPLARRIAAEHNVDIAQIKGSSPHGRVTKDDVINYLEQNVHRQEAAPQGQEANIFSPLTTDTRTGASPVPTTQVTDTSPSTAGVSPVPTQATDKSSSTVARTGASPSSTTQVRPETVTRPQQPVLESGQAGREERIRMSRRRQTIAQRLVEAQHTAAMLTTFNEIDMSAVMDVRARRKDAFKEKYSVSLGFMSFFTKATVGALKAFPRLNAEIEGNDMILKHYYDIGVAVSTDEGLVVPVVRDADRKSFAEIERNIADMAQRARRNALALSELQGGTFTITNGGIFGSLLSTPILNGPQVGILGMHKIEERPIAVKGQVVIRPMMYVALSYDHRIVDGSEAVRFLVKVKELVEDPETLLLEG